LGESPPPTVALPPNIERIGSPRSRLASFGGFSRNDVRVEVEHSDWLNYATVHACRPVVTSISVTNTGHARLKNALVEIAVLPGDYGSTWQKTIGPLKPRARWEYRHEDTTSSPETQDRGTSRDEIRLPWRIDRLRQVTEAERAVLQVTVSDNGRVLWRESTPLLIHPYNHWFASAEDLHVLSAFVTPNGAAVQQIISKAGVRSFNGYQSHDPHRVCGMLAALHDTLAQDCRLAYINPPASFEQSGQKIRLPEETLNAGRGTCLDLTVLLASLAEQIGLHPILILVPGHAFVGCWTAEEWQFPKHSIDVMHDAKVFNYFKQISAFEPRKKRRMLGKEESTPDEAERIRRIQRSLQGDMIVFNSVTLCHGRGFENAIDAGLDEVKRIVDPVEAVPTDQQQPYMVLIDVKACRDCGVRPLP
jgi:hypothetical protein